MFNSCVEKDFGNADKAAALIKRNSVTLCTECDFTVATLFTFFLQKCHCGITAALSAHFGKNAKPLHMCKLGAVIYQTKGTYNSAVVGYQKVLAL